MKNKPKELRNITLYQLFQEEVNFFIFGNIARRTPYQDPLQNPFDKVVLDLALIDLV